MNNKVILIGGFHEIIELLDLCSIEVMGIIDNHLTGYYLGNKVIGSDAEVESFINDIIRYPLIITPDNPQVRNKLKMYYSSYGFSFHTVVSPNAIISKSAIVSSGVIVQSGVNISSYSKIGEFVKLNTRANVMHDVSIGDYSTIAPNAVILGHVTIGKRNYIGANSTILPGVVIGDDVVVGAGSVVTKDAKSNSIVKGIPAK
jgi:sugar O-acyltransferase (sialic acid O-acetyltransferase NeuD family)